MITPMPMPIHTISCPCCAGGMPAWVTIVVLSILAFLLIIAIPIWVDIIGGILKLWSEFIGDIKLKIKHRRDR